MVDRRQALIEMGSRGGQSRRHSRSASWSFTGGRSGSTGDLSSLITGSAMTMIREVLPVSLTDELSERNAVPLTPRTRGTTTLGQGLVGIPQRAEILTNDGSSEPFGSRSVSLSQIVEDSGSEEGMSQAWSEQAPPFTPTAAMPSAEQAEPLPENEGNEIITWLEQNALFLFVIFVKIAWSYKFGESIPRHTLTYTHPHASPPSQSHTCITHMYACTHTHTCTRTQRERVTRTHEHDTLNKST